MILWLPFISIFFAVLGSASIIRGFWLVIEEKKAAGDGVYKQWWRDEVMSLGARQLLIIVIWTMVTGFSLTALMYWADGPKGFSAMLNYLSFAAPCVGAMIVGLGILRAKPKADHPLLELDFRYFFYGLPCLLVGYTSFVGYNKSGIVDHGVWIMALLAVGVPLVAKRLFGVPTSIAGRRESGFALLCYGAALIFLIASYVVA